MSRIYCLFLCLKMVELTVTMRNEAFIVSHMTDNLTSPNLQTIRFQTSSINCANKVITHMADHSFSHPESTLFKRMNTTQLMHKIFTYINKQLKL